MTKILIVHGMARPWYLRRRTRDAKSLEWMQPFADYLRRECNAKVELFLWDGRLLTTLLPSTARSCFEAIRGFFEPNSSSQAHEKRVLISKSSGCLVVDWALGIHDSTFAKKFFDVEIRIAPPIHSQDRCAPMFRRRYLVLSRTDKLYGVARTALWPLRPFLESVDPNQQMICLDSLSHYDLNLDKPMHFHNTHMTLFELYARLIQADLSWAGRR